MALYKRVLVKMTKWMKKHSFLGVGFSINCWNLKNLSHYTQHHFKNAVFFFVSFPMLTEKHAPLFCQFFGFGYNLKTFLSICRSLFVLLRLSTHPSKTGEELLYYHIYHELLLLNLTFQPELFNGPFVYTFF